MNDFQHKRKRRRPRTLTVGSAADLQSCSAVRWMLDVLAKQHVPIHPHSLPYLIGRVPFPPRYMLAVLQTLHDAMPPPQI